MLVREREQVRRAPIPIADGRLERRSVSTPLRPTGGHDDQDDRTLPRQPHRADHRRRVLADRIRCSGRGTRQHDPLSFDVHFAGFFLLDFGPDGVRQVTSFNQPFDPSRGDQTMFRDQMLRNGKVVGHDGGLCTVTQFVPTDTDPIKLTCQVNFELPGGQITTEGITTNNPVKHLAVTGGTGRYTGAAGDLVLTEFGVNDAGSAVFHLVGVRG